MSKTKAEASTAAALGRSGPIEDFEFAKEWDEEAKGQGRKPTPLSELINAVVTPPRWAIPNLAARGRLTTLYASVGTGKSTLYWEAIAANSQGRDFLHLYPFEEAQVFIVYDWENHAEDVGNMWQRLGVNASRGDTVHYFKSPEGISLDTSEGRAEVEADVLQFKATCVVFDNRDAAFPQTGENEGSQVVPAMKAAQSLAEKLDTAFLLVSHEPKAQYANHKDNLRGHTGWGQHSDHLYRLYQRGDLRKLSHEKHRAMSKRPELAIRFEVEGHPDTGTVTLKAEEAATKDSNLLAAKEEVVALLTEHGPMNWGALEEKVGSTLLRRALKALTKEGHVGQAGKRQPYFLNQGALQK
jgi:hypothetical protein